MTILALFAAVAVVFPADSSGVLRDSVVRDSIYELAVNPADYPKDASMVLLDEGVYRIEPDGRWSRTLRQVVQIIKARGALRYREPGFSYDPEREKLTINWMRVVKPNGEIVSAAPEQVQESDVPASVSAPTYTSTKVKRMSLSGLDSGTVLDYSYTTEQLKPPMAGDFLHTWRVNPASPVVRSLMVVSVPQTFSPRITEKNLNFRRTERIGNGRRTYTWATSNVKPPKVETFAPDTSIKTMLITVSAPLDWRAIGNWYAPVVAPRYSITPAVSNKIKKVVAGSKSLDDSIAAIQKWVSTDVRYVAILLGQGGYVPRDAETVTRTAFGDCKDKAMLFLAALRSIGVSGHPVLLNAFAKVDESVPAIEAFNHVIAAVDTRAGVRYADLTVPDMAFGDLPPGEGGKFGVLVKDGASETIHLPDEYAASMNSTMNVVGEIDSAGFFNGMAEERLTGMPAGFLRSILKESRDSATRVNVARSIARRFFDESDADSLVVAGPEGTQKAVIMRARIRNAKAGSDVANLWLLNNPVRPFTSPTRIADDLAKAPVRTLPIDLSRILSSTEDVVEATLRLPAGWKAILPTNISYSGILGRFELSFVQSGNELRISRTISGSKAVVGPDKLASIIADLKLIGADRSRVVAIQKQ